MFCQTSAQFPFCCLFQGLKKKISIDELLRGAQGGGQHSQVTTSLLNLVMQFRKVAGF